jgi:hypothetical protein
VWRHGGHTVKGARQVAWCMGAYAVARGGLLPRWCTWQAQPRTCCHGLVDKWLVPASRRPAATQTRRRIGGRRQAAGYGEDGTAQGMRAGGWHVTRRQDGAQQRLDSRR